MNDYVLVEIKRKTDLLFIPKEVKDNMYVSLWIGILEEKDHPYHIGFEMSTYKNANVRLKGSDLDWSRERAGEKMTIGEYVKRRTR